MDDEKKKKPNYWNEKLKRHVPILRWLPRYEKLDLLADAIAGFTLGLTLIPQSVAYATLAGLSQEYGLYSSFMGNFIYVIFGTIKEVSVGPTSLLCLLTFEFTKDLPIDYVFLLGFLSGCVEFLLGLLQLGFLVSFISVPVTTSFQSATAMIIISSQLKDLLGLPKFKTGRFIKNIFAVGERLNEAKIGDMGLSLFCCIFLLLLRKLKDVKIVKSKDPTKREKILEKTLWFISISRNAICVLISIIVAYVFSSHGETPFKLSGNIPSGLPPFRPLKFSIPIGNETMSFTETVYQIGTGILIIPLISILANVTIAKAFFSAGSSIDATQEMITLGLCNIFGSFVGSVPTCGAFTRSAVSNSSGVRTPLAGLFTGTLIILVIKFLTPYFYYIPRATLASVLVCAVIFMIDWRTILLLWKVNSKYSTFLNTLSCVAAYKPDFACSIATFTACLTLGVQFGLLFGVAVNVMNLLYLWARPIVTISVKTVAEGSYYLVTPDIGLYFPATDFLQNSITRKCVQNFPIVIDCVHLKGMDYTTARAIRELGHNCKKKSQKLVLKNLRSDIYSVLKNSNVDISLKHSMGDDRELSDVLFYSDEEVFSAILLEEDSKQKKSENAFEEELLIKCEGKK